MKTYIAKYENFTDTVKAHGMLLAWIEFRSRNSEPIQSIEIKKQPTVHDIIAWVDENKQSVIYKNGHGKTMVEINELLKMLEELK